MGTRTRIEVGEHLVIDPEICHGQLTFRGTRVPVETVLTFIAGGSSIDDILDDWSYLSREAVTEAIHLACQALLSQHGLHSRTEMIEKSEAAATH